MTATSMIRSPARIPIVQAAAAGAATLGAVYVVCWIGTQFPGLTVSHMFLALFTSAPTTSTAALLQGLFWSLVFGTFSAGGLAAFYNLFTFLGRRPR